MHRALPLFALLVVPTLELEAQRGSGSADSDSTETSAVQAIGLAGGIGFSLLRLAVTRHGGPSAQTLCYSACTPSNQAAALALTSGPAPYTAQYNEPPALPAQAKTGPVLPPQASENARDAHERNAIRKAEQDNNGKGKSGDVFEYKNDAPSIDDVVNPKKKGLDLVGHGPGVTPTETACALHLCAPEWPFTPQPPNGNGDVYEFGDNPGGAPVPPPTLDFEGDVLVNPEPGTWALLAAGLGGLGVVARRRRR